MQNHNANIFKKPPLRFRDQGKGRVYTQYVALVSSTY